MVKSTYFSCLNLHFSWSNQPHSKASDLTRPMASFPHARGWDVPRQMPIDHHKTRWSLCSHISTVYIYNDIYIYICIHTSSTAQGGGGSFKNRKPIGELGCCESGMAERSHWWIERCLRSPLFLSLFLWLSTYLPAYLLCIYLSIDLSISLFLSFI